MWYTQNFIWIQYENYVTSQCKDFGKEVMLNAIRVKVYIERKSSK